MSASLGGLRRTPARLCTLMTAALINVGSIVQAAEVPSYCAELTQAAALVLAKDKFASIIGAAREGNFLDSKIALPGWGDCSCYETRTYTCDSHGFKTANEGAAYGLRMGRFSMKSKLVFAAAGSRIQVEPPLDMLCCTTKGSWPRSRSTPA
jgi:hypothetical protein